MRLIHVSAHYKGDQDDGLTIRLTPAQEQDLAPILTEVRQYADRIWRAAADSGTTAELIRELESQLRAFVVSRRRQGSLSDDDRMSALAHIDLLERVGHLRSDEYNGVVLMYHD
jgi:hypothetical protein